MPCRAMNAFAKSLELSSCAAACAGPKIFCPAARKASTMPAASGPSGPTTVSATCSRRANSTRSGMAVSATLVSDASRAVPALPGATNTLPTRGLWAIFHASACSLPPEPTTRMFKVPPSAWSAHRLVPEVANSGKDHGNAALVGGGDHFLVAHAAARLDHRHRAIVGDDIQAVAERKECVGGDDRSRERQAGVLRLDRGDSRRVHATHLARTDAQRTLLPAVHDRVGLHELGDSPREQEIGELIRCRRLLRDHLEIGGGDVARVRRPDQGAPTPTIHVPPGWPPPAALDGTLCNASDSFVLRPSTPPLSP